MVIACLEDGSDPQWTLRHTSLVGNARDDFSIARSSTTPRKSESTPGLLFLDGLLVVEGARYG